MAAEPDPLDWPVLDDGTLNLGALPDFIAALAGAIIFAENCGAVGEVRKCYKKIWLARCIIEDGIVPVGAGPDKTLLQ